MHSKLITTLALTPLALAMPAKRSPINEAALSSIGETLETLTKRIDAKVYRNQIPDCATEDPSFMIPKQTGYAVEQGIKLPKNGSDDACTTGHHDDHCWTEYWLVETAIEYGDWQKSDNAIDCASTSECTSGSSESEESCSSFTHSETQEVSFDILSLGLEAGGVSLGSGVGYTESETNSWTTEYCTTKSESTGCTWDDQECHQVWYSQHTRRIWGHMDRVCVGRTKAEVQQQTRTSNGFWVRGQAEFSIALPLFNHVGCDALCSDTAYDWPVPNDAAGRVPVSSI